KERRRREQAPAPDEDVDLDAQRDPGDEERERQEPMEEARHHRARAFARVEGEPGTGHGGLSMITGPGSEMRLRLPRRARHVAFIVVTSGAFGLAVGSRVRVDSTGDRATALASALKKRGLEVSPQDVQWMGSPGALLGGDVLAVVRASPSATEPSDVFLVET